MMRGQRTLASKVVATVPEEIFNESFRKLDLSFAARKHFGVATKLLCGRRIGVATICRALLLSWDVFFEDITNRDESPLLRLKLPLMAYELIKNKKIAAAVAVHLVNRLLDRLTHYRDRSEAREELRILLWELSPSTESSE